nr:uncharacterized protein LOC110365253 isoform X19 [Columba livia]
MGLSLQRLAQLCAMSESTETRVISNVNCRLLNYFKPSYDSKSSMILKEMGRVFTNWFCPPPAYEEELSDTRAEVQHALSSPDAGGRSRLLVSNRRLLQHSGTSRSGHCWAPEEFGTGHAPPAGSSQHPAALSSSELPCSRRSRAPGPELQDGIAQSNETRSVPCHRKGDGVAAVTEEDRQYLKNQQLQSVSGTYKRGEERTDTKPSQYYCTESTFPPTPHDGNYVYVIYCYFAQKNTIFLCRIAIKAEGISSLIQPCSHDMYNL